MVEWGMDHAPQAALKVPPHEPALMRRHPETFGLESMSYGREVPQVIRDLAPQLHRFEGEVDPDEVREIFAGVYPREEIESDLALVERRELTFEKEDTQQEKITRVYSLALEYIIADGAHVWFKDCSIWRSFKFDDYQRQVDLFMDVPIPGGEPVTLGLDVASGFENTQRKIQRAHDEYQRGQFHDVKYFASDTDPDRKRGFALVPLAAIGASRFGISSLARAYRNYLRAPIETKMTELLRLQYHPLAGQLYEELLTQLEQAYIQIRRKARETPGAQHSRTHVLSGRLRQLQAAQNQLKRLYAQWQKERNDYLKQDRDFAAGDKELENDVLEAVRSF